MMAPGEASKPGTLPVHPALLEFGSFWAWFCCYLGSFLLFYGIAIEE
jgi:hypothetical protein